MPPPLVPRAFSAHRIAAKALLHALLRQSLILPVSEAQRARIQNIIRNRFRQTRNLNSVKRLRFSFEAGYAAVDHFDNAVAGDDASRSYILELLASAPQDVKDRDGRLEVVKGLRAEAAERQEKKRVAVERRRVGGRSILDRPIPKAQLTGKRHIPVLFSANQIPVLRIKKPQPQFLSRYILHRIRTRQKRHDRRHLLDFQYTMAKHEDEWDTYVAKRFGVYDGDSRSARAPGSSWKAPIAEARAQVLLAIRRERERAGDMAGKMQEVVDRETEMWEVERAEAKRGRWRRRGKS